MAQPSRNQIREIDMTPYTNIGAALSIVEEELHSNMGMLFLSEEWIFLFVA